MTKSYSSSPPKIERRVIEKNRRNHMKTLYSKLYSLLPNHSSKEIVPLPDQIDEVVNYIKFLQTKLEKSKEKRETLSGTRKRTHSCINESIPSLKTPKIEIQEMGHSLSVTLVTEHNDKFIFREIIRLIHEEGAEVLSANFSVTGNSIFHAVHVKVGEFMPNFVATRVSNKLKEFVNGSISDIEESLSAESWDVEESLSAESWEFEIQPNLLDLEIPNLSAMVV